MNGLAKALEFLGFMLISVIVLELLIPAIQSSFQDYIDGD